MKLIQKVTLTLTAIATITIASNGVTAYAAEKKEGLTCGGVNTSIIGGDICKGAKKDSKDVDSNPIWSILNLILNIMAGGVAIAAIAGFVYGAILYATAEDKADRVSKAKQTIFNVVLGLVLFAFMFSLLQFLIPGGIFR